MNKERALDIGVSLLIIIGTILFIRAQIGGEL